jgi:hypothetical protein
MSTFEVVHMREEMHLSGEHHAAYLAFGPEALWSLQHGLFCHARSGNGCNDRIIHVNIGARYTVHKYLQGQSVELSCDATD